MPTIEQKATALAIAISKQVDTDNLGDGETLILYGDGNVYLKMSKLIKDWEQQIEKERFNEQD